MLIKVIRVHNQNVNYKLQFNVLTVITPESENITVRKTLMYLTTNEAAKLGSHLAHLNQFSLKLLKASVFPV